MAMPRTASSCGIFCRMGGAGRSTWDASPTLKLLAYGSIVREAKGQIRTKRRGRRGRAPDQFAGMKISKLIAEFHSLADCRKRPVPAAAEAHPQERRLRTRFSGIFFLWIRCRTQKAPPCFLSRPPPRTHTRSKPKSMAWDPRRAPSDRQAADRQEGD